MASQSGYGGAVTSAMAATRFKKELELLDKQKENLAAQGQKASAEAQDVWRRLELLGDWKDGTFKPGPLWRKAEHEANSAKAISILRTMEVPQMENLARIAGSKQGEWLTILRYILGTVKGSGG